MISVVSTLCLDREKYAGKTPVIEKRETPPVCPAGRGNGGQSAKCRRVSAQAVYCSTFLWQSALSVPEAKT